MSVEIIAELGNSHGGNLGRALRLIDAAKAAGVSTVKWQCFEPDELVALRGDGPAPEPWGSQGWTMRRLYEKAATPFDWFPVLVQHCNDVGIPWFSSVFGPQSLALMESLGCPRYKLAALDYGVAGLRKIVRGTGRPLVVSHRGEWAEDARWEITDMYLWCPAGYPQGRPCLRGIGGGYAGFSYHGTNWRVPVAAVPAGARIVEFHFHLASEPNELEADCCLNEDDTARAVAGIREVEVWL